MDRTEMTIVYDSDNSLQGNRHSLHTVWYDNFRLEKQYCFFSISNVYKENVLPKM